MKRWNHALNPRCQTNSLKDTHISPVRNSLFVHCLCSFAMSKLSETQPTSLFHTSLKCVAKIRTEEMAAKSKQGEGAWDNSSLKVPLGIKKHVLLILIKRHFDQCLPIFWLDLLRTQMGMKERKAQGVSLEASTLIYIDWDLSLQWNWAQREKWKGVKDPFKAALFMVLKVNQQLVHRDLGRYLYFNTI